MKKRNPIAKAVTRIKPKIIPDKRRAKIKKALKKFETDIWEPMIAKEMNRMFGNEL